MGASRNRAHQDATGGGATFTTVRRLLEYKPRRYKNPKTGAIVGWDGPNPSADDLDAAERVLHYKNRFSVQQAGAEQPTSLDARVARLLPSEKLAATSVAAGIIASLVVSAAVLWWKRAVILNEGRQIMALIGFRGFSLCFLICSCSWPSISFTWV